MKNQTKITADPGKQELYITREVEGPRDLVFRVFNEPELMKQWLGPHGMTMEIEKLDSRTGGAYRFIHCDAAGNKYSFNGVIHEIAAPERMIRTFEFEGLPERGHVSLEFLTLEALPDNRTRINIQCVFRSVMDRDGMIASGMEKGMNEGYERMEELLEKMKTNN